MFKAVLIKFLKVVCKSICAILLVAIMALIGTSITYIYDFKQPEPFSGEDIYNPYLGADTLGNAKRANFHVHTRVERIFNECEYWPAEVYNRLEKFGYNIVTFSNHNYITEHPFNPDLQVNVYEHGYNLFKYHKLVFGSQSVNKFDHLLPILASQKQFQIDMLGSEADLVQINHPLRTNFFSANQLKKLEGYTLIELDSGRSTENEYWDAALSAGHYCFGVANDDLHYPDKSGCIAVRCNFLYTDSILYKDILQVLRKGAFYAMRIPDYGNGDWEYKYKMNKQLPYIKNIGLKDSTIYIALSVCADSIKVTGDNHCTLAKIMLQDTLSYTMQPKDTYARITAYFPEGEVIYTNPFARYNKSENSTPFNEPTHTVNVCLTVLFNLLLALLFIGVAYLLYKLIFKK